MHSNFEARRGSALARSHLADRGQCVTASDDTRTLMAGGWSGRGRCHGRQWEDEHAAHSRAWLADLVASVVAAATEYRRLDPNA